MSTSNDLWATDLAEAWDKGYLTGYQDRRKERDYDTGQNPYRAAAHTDEEIRAAMGRRRHLAEMTRQAFADGLYETAAEDYAEALRSARGKNPAATTEDAARVMRDDVIQNLRKVWSTGHDEAREVIDTAEELLAQALPRLLATARALPTREQIAEHLRKRANDDEDHASRLYTFSAEEWDRWYDEHLTVSHQINGKSLRIEGRPETIADVVLALLRGGVA